MNSFNRCRFRGALALQFWLLRSMGGRDFTSAGRLAGDNYSGRHLLKRMFPVANKLQDTYEAAVRFERGLALHPKSFANDLDGLH